MDAATLLVAGTGVVTAVGGIILGRRGQKDTERQQIAVNKVAEQKNKLDETQQALDAYERVFDMQKEELIRSHARGEVLEAAILRERDKTYHAQQEIQKVHTYYQGTLQEILAKVRALPGEPSDAGKLLIADAEKLSRGTPYIPHNRKKT